MRISISRCNGLGIMLSPFWMNRRQVGCNKWFMWRKATVFWLGYSNSGVVMESGEVERGS